MTTINPEERLGNAYLRERGVLEESFAEHGGEIQPMEITTISKRLNRVRLDKAWQAVQSILWVPVHGFNGEHHWLARPLPELKKTKFVAANGSRSIPWIPPATRSVAKDVGAPLLFTEGPIKAMALLQAGAFPIGLIGVWPLASKRGDRRKRYLPPELARNFEWLRRRVYVCFDADKLKKPGVRHAEIRLCFLLHSAGAEVFVLSWPLSEGKGIDDYLAGKAGTDIEKQRAALQKLIDGLKPFLETLEPADIVAAKRELHRTQPDRARFDQLAKLIYKPLGLSAKSSLGKFQGGDTQKDGQDPGGAKAVEIPATAKPWDGEASAQEVLDEICEAEKRFVWMKPSQRRAVALWIVLTYLHDAVDILPILLISSPEEECGKSTLLKLVLYLSNRPVRAGNISAAAIYRTIKDICPTMCLDEAETYLKDNEEMRGVIDSGHEREFAWVIRTAMEGEDTVQFSTWCPKALAQIGLPKRTILSRSIHIRLSRKLKDAKTEKLRKKHYQEFEDLRRKISGLAEDIRDHVKAFEDETLENRAGDN